MQERQFQERRLPKVTELPGAVREGLRERKKRMTRQLISDTATAMFLEHGFDAVRVAEVAEAAGVSEKTVYNYFPTKESLILDVQDDMEASIRAALGPGAPNVSPIDAAVEVILQDLSRFYQHWDSDHGGERVDVTLIRRFSDLVQETPSLRAAWRDAADRMVEVAAEAMAARAGVSPDDPEPQIAANAIVGLWRVQYRAMRQYSDGSRSPAEVADAVAADVRRAARLIDTGLWSFGIAVQGSSGREQIRLAAEAANEARKQVLAAIRQARVAWRMVVADAQAHEHDHRQELGRASDPASPPQARRRGRQLPDRP
jgi:AcrR family transcriptional regulator